MGKYCNEQKVKNGNFPKVYPLGESQPQFSNRLVAIYDRLIFVVCVDVSKESEWHEHYNQYMMGHYVSAEFYDVPFDVDIEN